ncbi:glycosyltransferase family 2 protein [Hymenobacter jejuensis]|nr:glycosyltransferase [Hymenobacter jejuensis]
MPSPLVSVVMPVYNTSDYVEEAILSILNQSFTDFEFLIFNDGSTDNSAEIIRSFKDRRIRFYDHPLNTGYVVHLNKGIELSRGCFIARMDADDIAHPDRLKIQVEYLLAHPCVGVCGSQVRYIGRHNGESAFPTDNDGIRIALMAYCSLWHPSVMIRKEVLTAHKLTYDPDFLYTEDYDLWCKLTKVTQLVNLPDYLLSYRKHDNQVSIVKEQLQTEAIQIIGQEYLKSLGFDLSQNQSESLKYLSEYPITINDPTELKHLLEAMNKIRTQNFTLKIFNPEKLDAFLQRHWIKIVDSIKYFNPKFIIPLVNTEKTFIKNLNIFETIKYIIKSLLYWNTRI